MVILLNVGQTWLKTALCGLKYSATERSLHNVYEPLACLPKGWVSFDFSGKTMGRMWLASIEVEHARGIKKNPHVVTRNLGL